MIITYFRMFLWRVGTDFGVDFGLSGFIIKRMSDGFKEESEQENGDFYSLYREDETLKKEIQPCKLSQLLRFSNPVDRLLMALGCFFALGNGVSLVFYSQPLKDLVLAFDPHSDPQQILDNLSFAIKAFLINSIFVFLNASLMTITWTLTSQRQLIRVRNLYFESLLKQEFAWYDRNKPQEVCSQMYMQTERAQSSLVESINSLLTTISMGFGGIIYALAHGWKMAIVMAGFIPVMLATNYMTTRLAKRWETKFVDQAGNIGANVIETFENIKTVKYMGGQDYEIAKFSEQAEKNSNHVKEYGRRTVFTSAITFFCIIFNYALGFWYGTKLVADRVYNSSTGKTYDVGDVVSIFFCVYMANLNISGMGGHITNFFNSRVALSRIIAIIDRRPRQTQGSESCITGINKIQFRDIAFHYSQPLFQRLSLTIQKGVVAIVGSSGNGKSTLLYLLMKFYDPFKGQILLHGSNSTQNLKDVERKSLRSRIGYVGQEPVLLGNTIRQVLGSAKEDAIWKALSICCAEEFVRNIGLDADFKALSGGQKQRIAIARAVLRDPQILVLDEGTSALDGINERKLLRNLKEKSKIEFIFMIAHRTETLSQAQTIIKVDRGSAEIIHSELAVRIAQKSCEEESAVQERENEGNQQRQQEEQEKAVFKFSYFRTLLHWNGSMKKYYIVGIISAMFLGVIFPSFSYIITRLCSIVTDIQYATTSQEIEALQWQASTISLFLLGISVASIGLTVIKGRSFLAIGESIGLKTRIYAYNHLVKLELSEIERIGRTNITHLINKNANCAKIMVSELIANMSEHFFTLIVGLSIAFIYCWQITFVSLFLVPLSLIGGKLQQKFLSGLSENADKVYRKTHQIVKEAVIHNRTVKSLNLEEYYCAKYRKQQSKGFRRSIKDSVLSGITLGVSQCLISLMISLIYYIGALFSKHYGVSIVDLFTAIYAIMFSGVQAGCNIGFVGQIAENSVGTARYFKILGLDSENAFEQRQEKNVLVEQLQDESVLGLNNEQIRGNVQFKGVSFRYPHRDDYVFRNLSFTVEEGKRVAIVGQSGSGKTTIADLLFKIYRPEQGEVLVDGVSTAIYSRSSLAQNLAIVSQEPALFNRSVIENIRYNTEASEKEIKEAARISNAFDFIEAGGFGVQADTQKESNNWERVVGSRGSLLSGGQKQRVAIARAIVRKPRIMVFDEATSALDKETQQSLLLNVSKSLKMTQIIIAHRLSTIRACDAIIVLKEGKVVQYGEYDELVRQKGEFSRLVNALSEHP